MNSAMSFKLPLVERGNDLRDSGIVLSENLRFLSSSSGG